MQGISGGLGTQSPSLAPAGSYSQWPRAIRSVEHAMLHASDVAMPWAVSRGLDLYEVCRSPTPTNHADLYLNMTEHHDRSLNEPIPIYGSDGGAPHRRICTADWKVQALQRWLRDNDFTPAVFLIGISVDEIQPAN